MAASPVGGLDGFCRNGRMHNAINIEGAIIPARQHSHAVIANGLVFVSAKGPDERR